MIYFNVNNKQNYHFSINKNVEKKDFDFFNNKEVTNDNNNNMNYKNDNYRGFDDDDAFANNDDYIL